jgi:hypothetical protein
METAVFVAPFLVILVVAGFVKLLYNWQAFGDRAWPMLLVTLVVPLGALWPLFSQVERQPKVVAVSSRRKRSRR